MSNRRVGFDGSIKIYCSSCGEYLYTSPSYAGFSTVTCIKCQEARKKLREVLEHQKKGNEKK